MSILFATTCYNIGIYTVYMLRLKHVFAKTINHFDPKTVIEDPDVYGEIDNMVVCMGIYTVYILRLII